MKRLHALDTLRGVAALAIVVWHWQHFYAISGVWQAGWQRTAQPLYWVLKPLYDAGWAAVDLFFALSGFIFFWLYAPAIRERAMGLGKFAWLRFSRLYPLFFVTLIVAAILQYFFHRATGHFQRRCLAIQRPAADSEHHQLRADQLHRRWPGVSHRARH